MGELIAATAEISRVEEHIRDSYKMGLARGGEIGDAAKTRLASAVASIDASKTLLASANDAESAAWATVVAIDGDADVGIGAIRDEMWNALGRPRQSSHMDEVFPEGIGTYTSGDPRGQPVLMQVLAARIRASSAPQWSDAQRNAWAARVEALCAPYAAAVETYRPVEAAATVAQAAYRAAVRGGHVRLRSFKRDLKSLGLSEAQIHEIIPDASAGKKKTPVEA